MSEKFQDLLKQVRAELSLSQAQVASALKVSRAAVGQWERGETTPSFQNLQQFNIMITQARAQKAKLSNKYSETYNSDTLDMEIAEGLVAFEFLLAGRKFRKPGTGLKTPVKGIAIGQGHIIHVSRKFKNANFGDAFDFIPTPTSLREDMSAYAVCIYSEALEPRYEKGDVLFCSKNHQIDDGDYIIAWPSDRRSEHFGRIYKVHAQIEDLLKVRDLVDQQVTTIRRGPDWEALDRIVPWGDLIAPE